MLTFLKNLTRLENHSIIVATIAYTIGKKRDLNFMYKKLVREINRKFKRSNQF